MLQCSVGGKESKTNTPPKFLTARLLPRNCPRSRMLQELAIDVIGAPCRRDELIHGACRMPTAGKRSRLPVFQGSRPEPYDNLARIVWLQCSPGHGSAWPVLVLRAVLLFCCFAELLNALDAGDARRSNEDKVIAGCRAGTPPASCEKNRVGGTYCWARPGYRVTTAYP